MYVVCGCCSGELGKGRAGFVCDDPDELEPPSIVLYCPPCANDVCAWDPIPRRAAESS